MDAANLALWQTNLVIHRRGPNPVCHRARCNEIVMELNDIYLDRGLLKYRSFGYGHSFGVLLHYLGCEAGLELRDHVEAVHGGEKWNPR